MKATDLLQDFGKHYNFLYENAENEAIQAIESTYIGWWDEEINKPDFRQLVSDFVESRGDYLTSDREITAFMLAIQTVNNREMLKRINEGV